jgi:hypothetical protein
LPALLQDACLLRTAIQSFMVRSDPFRQSVHPPKNKEMQSPLKD